MIDPIHSLAISIHANRGVYAVLLGSGVSRAAKFQRVNGVTTGKLGQVLQSYRRQLCLLQPAAHGGIAHAQTYPPNHRMESKDRPRSIGSPIRERNRGQPRACFLRVKKGAGLRYRAVF